MTSRKMVKENSCYRALIEERENVKERVKRDTERENEGHRLVDRLDEGESDRKGRDLLQVERQT